MKKIYPSSAPDFVAIIGFLLILIISVWISIFWIPNIYIIIGTIALNIIIIANYFLMKPIVIIEDDKVIIRNALKSYVFSIPEMEKIQKHHSAVAIRSFGIGGVWGISVYTMVMNFGLLLIRKNVSVFSKANKL